MEKSVASCWKRCVSVSFSLCVPSFGTNSRGQQGWKGLSAPQIKNKLSLRASITGSIFMDEVAVPQGNVLDVEGLKGPFSCLKYVSSSAFLFYFLSDSGGSPQQRTFRNCVSLHHVLPFTFPQSSNIYPSSASESSVPLKRPSPSPATTPSSGPSLPPASPAKMLIQNLDYSQQFGKPIASFQLVQKKLADANMEAAIGLVSAVQLGRLKDSHNWSRTFIPLLYLSYEVHD